MAAPLLLLALTSAVWASEVRAQTFDRGRVPPDVLVTVIPKPYPVQGDTPELLTSALRALGLGGYWMRFSSFYEWIYTLEELPTALHTMASGRCSFPSFRVDLRLSVEYPDWEPSANAPPVLIEAWDAFVALMERDFAERRDDVYTQLTELNRIARRLEVECPMAYTRLDELMAQLAQESREEAIEARERGERVVLQWPPPGFEGRGAAGDQIRTAQLGRPGGIFLVPRATTVALPPTDAERLLEEARMDRGRSPAEGLLVVAGVHREGETVYLEEFVNAPPTGGTPISPTAPLPYPGLTEVFVATLAAAFDSAGVLELAAPISAYLPEIDSIVGRVTLRQLLAHRSGIHNMFPDTAAGEDWSDGARRLDRYSLFTVPDAIYSYSGYDYPLALAVLESVARTDFPTLASSALFAPLGMTNTSIGDPVRGVPVTLTTASDVMAFLSTWVDGGLRGAPSLTRGSEAERFFDSGVWYDQVNGVSRVSLACESGGFQIFPGTGTAFMLWTSGRWPNGLWRYLLSQVGEEEGARTEVLEPTRARGAATLGAVDPPCREPLALTEQVATLGALTPSGDWAGRYRNGEQINDLADVGGFLKATNAQPLDVSHYEGDMHFVGSSGRAFYPLKLTRDTDGRRYLVLDGRAYIHVDDRP